MASTAAERFRRLLLILPVIGETERFSLSALAAKTGLSVETIMDDFRVLAERYDDPGGFVDGLGVYVEGDTAWIRSNPLSRPMKLSLTEWRALEVGMALLRRERPDVGVVDMLLTKLRTLIAGLPADVDSAAERDGALGSGRDAEVLPVIRRALRERMVISIRYQRPQDAEATLRDIHPHRLAFASGAWYLSAWCERSNDVRMFRVDRIVDAEPTDRAITHEPDETALSRLDDGTPFLSPEQFPTLTVRYRPGVARWITERDGLPLEADGSAVRTMPLADREWAIRHVLQHGTEIEVVEPTELRVEVVERLSRMIS